jgi:hypothetical protein
MRGPKDRHGIAAAVSPWRAETELVERRRLRYESKSHQLYAGPSSLKFQPETQPTYGHGY